MGVWKNINRLCVTFFITMLYTIVGNVDKPKTVMVIVIWPILKNKLDRDIERHDQIHLI